jgi:4-amino-4-deoxy-L-arabinose transferase-like glycosyltransferase
MLDLSLTIAQYGSFAVSVIALAILLAAGKAPERMAAAALIFLMFASPYLAREGPFAHALVSGVALAILTTLALRYDRWWLIGAAGLQLVVFSTHFASFVIPQELIWGTVTLRIVLWQALILLCLFAVGESRWAFYAQSDREGTE